MKNLTEERMETNQNSRPATPPVNSRTLLTFTLGGELFGLDVMSVREVIACSGLIPVLHAPQFIRGVLHLRGQVLPVLDLLLLNDLSPMEKTADSRVIVVDMVVEGTVIMVGILADSVHEVMMLPPTDYEPGPQLGTKANTDFIRTWARRLRTS